MTDNEKRFSFISMGLPGDTFGVVRFKGVEGLSKIYEFEVELVSSDLELDLNEVIQNPARLTFLRDQGNISFNGILSEFEQLHSVDDMCFYRAVLVPKVWWMSQTHYNQVFLNESIPDILEQVLRSGGLGEGDFEIKLEKDYPEWEYLCQYRESHMAFLQRLMEREGIYYYFEQTSSGEKLIITDTRLAHTPITEDRKMYYSPPSGLDDQYREEVIKNFSCRQKLIPKSVHLKDHNIDNPSMNVEGSADVFEEGRGEVYFFGDHFTTPEEGDRLAQIRAEEIQCWKQSFSGWTTIPFLRPGYTFTLDNHYRDSFNQDYLTVEIFHQGTQASFMLAGLSSELSNQEQQQVYCNTLTALPADVQFRPRRKTKKTRFYGTLHARIDAAGDGKYAELDEEGRYKVILPFDRSGRSGGKASAPLRMMQPYAGTNQGMHFPLRKGTEVLLTFINGDPDRPVIAGALPNPEAKSPVDASNQTMANLTTGGGNKIHMEDREGSERILMHCDSPAQQSYIRIGAHNDPEDSGTGGADNAAKDSTGEADPDEPKDGLKLFSIGDMDVRIQNKSETIQGRSSSTVYGMHSETVWGKNSATFGGLNGMLTIGSDTKAVIGSATKVLTGGEEEYNTKKAALIPFYTIFCGKQNKVLSTDEKLASVKTELIGNNTELEGKIEKLQAQISELQGDKKIMVGKMEALKGEVMDLEGSNYKLRGEVKNMDGKVSSLEGESSKMSGKVQNLEGSVTNLQGDVTNLQTKSTTLANAVLTMSNVDTKM